jgi:transcription initiation factor TFIIIB Brf1 subunit/transcription initiation factor TFIIB
LSNQKITSCANQILKIIENEQMLKGKGLEAKAVISLVMAMLKNKREPDYSQITKYTETKEEEIRNCYKLLKEESIF